MDSLACFTSLKELRVKLLRSHRRRQRRVRWDRWQPPRLCLQTAGKGGASRATEGRALARLLKEDVDEASFLQGGVGGSLPIGRGNVPFSDSDLLGAGGGGGAELTDLGVGPGARSTENSLAQSAKAWSTRTSIFSALVRGGGRAASTLDSFCHGGGLGGGCG